MTEEKIRDSIARDIWQDEQECDNYSHQDLNPRHLWDEHDSARWYTDPIGWEQHEKTCVECSNVSY